MADVKEVKKLKVDQLKELAAYHNVEVAESDKKDDLVLKISDAITPEDLATYNAKQADGSDGEGKDEGGTPPEGTGEAPATDGNNAAGSAPVGEQPTPPVAAGRDTEATHESNAQVQPGVNTAEAKDAENEEAAEKEQARRDAAAEVDTKLGTSKEEKAAERAGVPKERLNDPKQNREPKNGFEQENQQVTEQERKAAQKASNVSTEKKEEKAQTPKQLAREDAQHSAATNQGNEIAQAIADGFKRSKDDSFELEADAGVEPRFSLVRNKDTGEVLLRENETGVLSQIQLKSLEEKEASLQDTEVEEL